MHNSSCPASADARTTFFSFVHLQHVSRVWTALQDRSSNTGSNHISQTLTPDDAWGVRTYSPCKPHSLRIMSVFVKINPHGYTLTALSVGNVSEKCEHGCIAPTSLPSWNNDLPVKFRISVLNFPWLNTAETPKMWLTLRKGSTSCCLASHL